MSYIQEFQGMMTEYAAAVEEVQKNRKMFDGVMGLGTHPGDAPCHDALDRQVKALCERAAAEGSPAEDADLVWAIFQAEGEWQGKEFARLMLVAIQRHTLPLLPELDAADRTEMKEWFEKQYPRRKRVPIQDQILKALKK